MNAQNLNSKVDKAQALVSIGIVVALSLVSWAVLSAVDSHREWMAAEVERLANRPCHTLYGGEVPCPE